MDDITASLVSLLQNTVPSPPPSSYSSSSSTVFTNYPFISAIIAFALAQSSKFFITWYKERRWDFKQLISSGGMPSSHSATVTALAIAIGFQDGFGGSVFAIAMILACVVLNQIVFELPAEHPLAETRPLRELLGHTPSQVIVGALLGFVTAVIAHLIRKATTQA
uniref:Acid phosphatase/vanadium-dependent haloperoxidase-related protein n=1 Tax=Nelumbo nucifera TaxID=4432 RepID=A0A822Y993_NELNU|nr:TPA_asm: hypothetical protein HUJ06_009485 [Nelumbo nucifera]